MENEDLDSKQITPVKNARQGKNIEVAILLDVYGDMLTEKQRDLIDLYYNEDLSLGEISQNQNITRQGVRDSIKRGEQFLFELEDKLGILKKQAYQRQFLQEVLDISKDLYDITTKYNYDVKIINMAEKIHSIVSENIER